MGQLKVGGILLASGFGRRFGGNKLLTQVEGVSLAQRAMETLAAAGLDRVAVASQYPSVLELAPQFRFLPLYNRDAAEGISAGIRLGLTAMEGMDGVLFSVCDQPWLTPQSVQRLLDAFRAAPQSICALSWQGRRGNPAVFPSALIPALAALTGDTGGGAVIRQHPELLRLVEAHTPQELRDIDTQADL